MEIMRAFDCRNTDELTAIQFPVHQYNSLSGSCTAVYAYKNQKLTARVLLVFYTVKEVWHFSSGTMTLHFRPGSAVLSSLYNTGISDFRSNYSYSALQGAESS